MPRRVSSAAVLLLLVVVLCRGTCEATPVASSDAGQSKMVEVFLSQETELTSKVGGQASKKRVELFSAPSLVGVDGVLVALSEAQYTGTWNTDVDIAAGCGVPGGAEWRTQLAVEMEKTATHHSFAIFPTAVVKDGKIYLLVNTETMPKDDPSSDGTWDIQLAVGTVADASDKNGKEITWQGGLKSLKSGFAEVYNSKSWRRLSGGGGAGIAMKGTNTLVLPVQVEGANNMFFSTIIHSADGSTWVLSDGTSDGGCTHPAIAEWEGKLLMMTACDAGYRKVYESSDEGKTWTEALGTLSRVWGNSPKRAGVGSQCGFVTATIDGKNVMLFAQPGHSAGEGGVRPERLHLWLSDGNHTHDAGPISDADERVFASTLLYAQERLFLLHEGLRGGKHGIFLTELSEELDRVKSVVGTWKELDKKISIRCTSTADKGAQPDSACVASKLTNGLVGFLSGNSSDHQWNDEYLGVHATVVGSVEKNANGLRFKGPGAGAEWPVGNQGQNQLYHFANSGFTLVATVSFHGEPKVATPLLGMSLGGFEDKLVELSYTHEKKWKVLCGDGAVKEHASTWEPGTTRQVALLLHGDKYSVYVDGNPLAGMECERGKTHPEEISHFYFGGRGSGAGGQSGADGIDVTVRDVLLYNRQLNGEELGLLFEKKDNVAVTPSTPSDPLAPSTPSDPLAPSTSSDPLAPSTPSDPLAPSTSSDPLAPSSLPSSLPGDPRDASGALSSGEDSVTLRNAAKNVQSNQGVDGSVCVHVSRVLLLLLLLGLWGFAAP